MIANIGWMKVPITPPISNPPIIHTILPGTVFISYLRPDLNRMSSVLWNHRPVRALSFCGANLPNRSILSTSMRMAADSRVLNIDRPLTRRDLFNCLRRSISTPALGIVRSTAPSSNLCMTTEAFFNSKGFAELSRSLTTSISIDTRSVSSSTKSRYKVQMSRLELWNFSRCWTQKPVGVTPCQFGSDLRHYF